MSLDWNKPDIVTEYTRASADPAKHWYESEVNIPSILSMLEIQGGRVLDFGCGPGGLTAQLAKTYTAVGADGSELMIKQAQQAYPDVEFLVWDGLQPLPKNIPAFNAIVSKLTMEFIPDLTAVAGNLHKTLSPGGVLIISVAHPMFVAHHHPDDPYWEQSTEQTQIGATGIVVTKIQRSLQDYINPFLDRSFTLTRVDEPRIPASVAEHYQVKPNDLQVPKRLNLQFRMR